MIKRQKIEDFLLEDNKEILQSNFYQLKTPRDVAKMLGISYKGLVHYLYLFPKEKRYKTFKIAKKTGGVREISATIFPLKIIQKRLNQVLETVYEVKPSVHGFVEGKNIVTNAKTHVKKRHILNIDLKDFFPSINFGRVRGMFMATPYNLPPDVATILAQICCHDNQLPQGAPTSPIISNMICGKMDSQLQRFAKECKATYTRYADDITFSTTLKNIPEDLAFLIKGEQLNKLILSDKLLGIIAENGFNINEKKGRLQSKGNHQEVTGLTINQFPNVKRKLVRQIRAMLHAWAKYGLENAQKDFNKNYKNKARCKKKPKLQFQQVVRGKIEFIAMVKGKDDPIYQKFLQQYKQLISNNIAPNSSAINEQESSSEANISQSNINEEIDIVNNETLTNQNTTEIQTKVNQNKTKKNTAEYFIDYSFINSEYINQYYEEWKTNLEKYNKTMVDCRKYGHINHYCQESRRSLESGIKVLFKEEYKYLSENNQEFLEAYKRVKNFYQTKNWNLPEIIGQDQSQIKSDNYKKIANYYVIWSEIENLINKNFPAGIRIFIEIIQKDFMKTSMKTSMKIKQDYFTIINMSQLRNLKSHGHYEPLSIQVKNLGHHVENLYNDPNNFDKIKDATTWLIKEIYQRICYLSTLK